QSHGALRPLPSFPTRRSSDLGLFYVVYSFYEQHQEWTLDIAALGGHCRTLPLETQALVLAAMLAGFAVKVPLFPVHTWLPLAHRSEEHTSELQSRENLVCRLL